MTRISTIRGSAFLAALAIGCATPSTSPDNNRDDGGDDAPRTGTVIQNEIEYEGDVLVMESFPVQLAGQVTITNRGSGTRSVVFPDGCVALLRAYRPGESTPVWDQASEVACTMALVEMELRPGEPQEIRTPTASGYEILDDQLPDGQYRITIYLRPDGGQVEIEAGTVDLAIPR
jgi:hypothetical protein